MTAPLLDLVTVVAYLRSRGLLSSGEHAEVAELDGGISNTVLAVETGSHSWVVKQSLPRLRVEATWLAKQERTLNEARGLSVAGALTPGHVPDVVHVDPERFVLVMQRAPAGMLPWKRILMSGTVDAGVATVLGGLLGRWHAATAAEKSLVHDLDDPEAFEQLRIAPYHRAAARALPDSAAAIMNVVDDMASRRVCLVHGDFSPKNVLTGPDGTWVLDFEVVHLGDPDFDVAFLLSHLVLKAVHRPEHRPALKAAAGAFVAAYDAETAAAAWRSTPEHLVGHLGALLLARTDGKSVAEYLTAADRGTVRATGHRLLLERPDSMARVWTVCEQEAAP